MMSKEVSKGIKLMIMRVRASNERHQLARGGVGGWGGGTTAFII